MAECHATNNTCRTCGGDHTTRDCNEPSKRYCVSCCLEDHASWDRMCLEFQQKSAHFNELHSENALTYFLIEESWTHNARPDRIPMEDRFPAKYAIGPPPTQKAKTCPDTTPNHKQRGHEAGKGAEVQGTLDKFIETQTAKKRTHPSSNEADQCNEEEDLEADFLNQTLLPNE